jgi:murein L,D-transpeptidase YcbB/YkuD
MHCSNLANRAVAALLFVFMLAIGVCAQDNSVRSNPSRMNASSSHELEGSGTTLRAIVASGRLEILQWPNFSDYRIQLETLYQRSGYAPVWIRDGAPTPQALEMISILQQADSKGLLAEDYDSSSWPQRLAHLQAQHTASDEARFDTALTVCTMRYVSDLRIGRINPSHLKFGRDIGPKEMDLPTLLENRLLKGTSLESALADTEPQIAVYGELQTALVRYMLLAKKDDGEKLPIPHGIVFFGTAYDGVPRLTRLLRLVGDLPEGAEIDADSTLYVEPLVQAVKRFQRRHGLRPDGFLTSDTIKQLNVPLSDRVEQIRLALERYRWLRYDFAQPPVIINVPGFRLYALNEEGKVGLEMTVDVGQEYTPTPVLENKIEYLVFRPYWDVPSDIQKDEIVANIKDDLNYLSTANFEAVAPDRHIVTEGKVSPEVLQQIDSGKLRIRQKPGPDNSLGLVKFIFPNQYSVYLHDTPSWGKYFADFAERDVSHGCVHLKEPAKLAAWVLRDKPEWTSSGCSRRCKTGRTTCG